MSIVTIPRNLSKVCKLFLERNYGEAEKAMEKVKDFPHQKAAIRAQLALFSWDFDKTVEYCMEYLPHLDEWYTRNTVDESFAMLAFSAMKCGREKEAVKYLDDLKTNLSDGEDERYTKIMLGSIKNTADILNGKICEPQYTPPDDPMTLDEAIEYLRKNNKKKDLTADTAEGADYILTRMYNKMDCKDFLMVYERFAKVQKFSEMTTRKTAVEMYLYLGQPDKVRQAICDSYNYAWIPAEKTVIMPISILTYDRNLWDIYTQEMFDYIYKTKNLLSESKA